MTIDLLSQEDHAKLLGIFTDFPALSFQNNGYEYLNFSKLTDLEKEKFKEAEDILRKHIHGFSKFNHFKVNRNGEPQLRFQYAWDVSFTGVGYLLIDELLNGFRN